MKDKAILGNIGHFDNEIDMARLERTGRSAGSTSSPRSTSSSSRRPLDHRVERGPAAEPRQCHRPPVVRDESNSFSNQVIAQIELWTKNDEYDNGSTGCPSISTRRWPRSTSRRSVAR